MRLPGVEPRMSRPQREVLTTILQTPGEAGYRSLYLPHAKRALYHLSYIPILTTYLHSTSNPLQPHPFLTTNLHSTSSPLELHPHSDNIPPLDIHSSCLPTLTHTHHTLLHSLHHITTQYSPQYKITQYHILPTIIVTYHLTATTPPQLFNHPNLQCTLAP